MNTDQHRFKTKQLSALLMCKIVAHRDDSSVFSAASEPQGRHGAFVINLHRSILVFLGVSASRR
jgi:hypothetical protein